MALLQSDAVLTMPPLPLRYVGRLSIASFFALIPRGSGRPALRLLPIRANRQPMVATYGATSCASHASQPSPFRDVPSKIPAHTLGGIPINHIYLCLLLEGI